MLRSRFLWTLYASYSTLILLSTLIVGGLTTRRIQQDALEDIRQSLRARAVMLRELAGTHIEQPSDPVLQQRLREIGGEIGTRLTVIRADGIVLADSDNNPADMDNHGNRPEILSVLSHGLGTATRFSDTMGVNMMYLALPTRQDGAIVGYVRTSLPLSVIDQRLGYVRAAAALGVVLAAFVALLLGFFLTRRIVKPIASMTRVAESIAEGDYEQRVHTPRKDEIGKLANALNRMAKSSSTRMETISVDRNKLSTILSGIVEGVVAVDQNERVLHLNRAAARVLGASPADSIDKPIWEVTRVREVGEILGTALRDKTEARSNLRIVNRSKDHVIELHASPLFDGQGELIGAVVVLHDVSELHRLERIRRDFVSNASHELKTPITAIRGLVETLIDDENIEPSKRERFLVKIRDQSMSLSSIVTDLLTLSRLESERGAPDEFPVDLVEAVKSEADALTPSSEQKGVALEVQLPDTPVELLGDEEALCQVARNLLDNALKYTPKGGRVDVRVWREGNEAVLEVQDTGIGIEPADQDRIFERFYRVDKARSRELGGTGLGLSIVKHIVLTYGGQVSVESVPGKGSTFRVSLPPAPPTARS